MAAKLLFTLICDDAREEKSGKLVVIGLYNYSIIFQPTLQRRGQGLAGLRRPAPAIAEIRSAATAPQGFALPQLCLVQRWYVDSPGDRARTELVEPDGRTVQISDIELPLPPTDNYYQHIVRIAGIILKLGRYTIRTISEKSINEEHFEVKVG